MRARLTTAVAVLSILAGAALGGCHVAVSGTAGTVPADQQRADRAAEQRTAVEAAIAELDDQSAIAYRTGANQTVQITRNGTVLGTYTTGGQPVSVFETGGTAYLRAPAAYWRAQHVDPAKAGQYAAGWVRADPKDGFDPGAALTPAAVATALRRAFAGRDQFAAPVRRTLADGTEVFDITLQTGKLQVSTATPHRVVAVEPAVLGTAAGTALGATPIVPVPLSDAALTRFRTDADTTVDRLGRPLDSAATVTALVTDGKLNCNGAAASCTMTAKVRTLYSGAATSVHVTLTVRFTSALGDQTCTRQADGLPNVALPVSCTARFHLAAGGGALVRALPTASADAVTAVDGPAVKQRIDAEFAELGA